MVAELLSLIPPALSYLESRKQKKLGEAQTPSGYIPSAQREATNLARVQANATTSPGASRTLDEGRRISVNNIDAITRSSSDPGRVLSAIAGVDKQEKDLALNVNAQNESFRVNALNNLTSQLGIEAGYQKENRDDYNRTVSELKGAETQNKYNALTKFAEIGTYFLKNSNSPKTPKTPIQV